MIQNTYNVENNVTPKTVYKSIEDVMHTTAVADSIGGSEVDKNYVQDDKSYGEMDRDLALEMMRQEMISAADEMEFERAAFLRDQIKDLEKELGPQKNANNNETFIGDGRSVK
tara:strand:- start:1202 stop:1540 length:339 start_codon:yes stop_codon:yes gene_type:complete